MYLWSHHCACQWLGTVTIKFDRLTVDDGLRNIEITSCHISFTVRWHRWLKSLLVEDKNWFILHYQHQGCWCRGDARSQAISSKITDLVIPEYSGLNTWRINSLTLGNMTIIKSLQIPGATKYLLYWFLSLHCCWLPSAADFSSRNNFWTIFHISFIFCWIIGPNLQITWLNYHWFHLLLKPWIKHLILVYIWKKCLGCHKMKNKHFDLMLGLIVWRWGIRYEPDITDS